MLVANAITGDSRVLKSAQAASEAGYRVTVIGTSRTDSRSVETLGDVRLVRVPVRFTLPDAATSLSRSNERARRAARFVRRHGMAGTKVNRGRARRAQTELGGLAAKRQRPIGLRCRRAIFEALARMNGVAVVAADQALRLADRRAADESSERQVFRARLLDLERACLAELAEIDFDLIHAHDFWMIECANRAVTRAAGRGVRPSFVYDAHEWVRGLAHQTRGAQLESAAVEAANIPAADAVLTVSPVLAQKLQHENALSRRPEVVLNAPLASPARVAERTVRGEAGVSHDVPLAVYSGVVKAARGVATIVRALPLLPDLHLAVVARTPYTADVKELVAEAACLGCDDRVRLVPYVEHDEVSGYLASADVGIHPLLRSGNAELALPNKLFEYLHAGLPMVVSDMPSMSQLVIERGWGEVFVADDHEDLARVLRRVLAHPSFYAAGLQDSDARTRFSWERQARTLIETYDRLLGGKDASASPRAVGSA